MSAGANAGLAPTLASPEVLAPVVVVTESAAQPAASAESRSGGSLLIIGVAAFLLGGAIYILRQASK